MTTTPGLDADLASRVLRATGARTITRVDEVQELWSGYGRIARCHLDGGERASVIVKHVRWPDTHDHPRGWSTGRSHERKVASYRVETVWYERYADRCPDAARVPGCLVVETRDDEVIIVLEDLDAAGFDGRRTQVDAVEIDACLRWLATFHAAFLSEAPEGLWPTGTYWHLATRPDELDAMPDGRLKAAAGRIDERLAQSRFQTFVHGDAKLANFCFDEAGARAAAVDFQYVGGGSGMKDLAYFIGSCLDEDECERLAPSLVDRYFVFLREAVVSAGTTVDLDILEADWRALYAFAWTDFSRFLQGWSPGHWKLHGYSDRLAAEVLDALDADPEIAPLSGDDLRRLADIAVAAATEAGDMIARSRPAEVDHKATGTSAASRVVTEIDRRSEALILEHLAPTMARFGLGLLTEERVDDGGRLTADHFWCIDPLDGTLPFIEDQPGSAVSIALVRRDGLPVIGAIHDPRTGTTAEAIRGSGVTVDGSPWTPPPVASDVLSVFADRSFVAAEDHPAVLAALDRIAQERGLRGVELHVGAGAVMNAWGALHRAPGCYLKFPAATGGGSLWDFAATACLFAEAGAIATDIHGEALDLNRPDSTFMHHRGVLFATDADLAQRLRAMAAAR